MNTNNKKYRDERRKRKWRRIKQGFYTFGLFTVHRQNPMGWVFPLCVCVCVSVDRKRRRKGEQGHVAPQIFVMAQQKGKAVCKTSKLEECDRP